MTRIEQAQRILQDLGMPKAQSNQMAALTLLVLAGIGRRDKWAGITPTSMTVHQVLTAMKMTHGRTYAENTRETVRRQVLHQFVQAALVERNPDDPSLATNSPRTHYRLTTEAANTISAFGTKGWGVAIEQFRSVQPALREIYARNRERHNVSLVLDDGRQIMLSPGAHNDLQVRVVAEFGPRFAPGAALLYLGDTERKALVVSHRLAAIGIDVSEHGKLPDIVLLSEGADLLFLIEAVTSHGPVSAKRQIELEALLADCDLTRAYVSAFPDFKTFKKYAPDVSWETDVWIAEVPDHLIHFNGGEVQLPLTT